MIALVQSWWRSSRPRNTLTEIEATQPAVVKVRTSVRRVFRSGIKLNQPETNLNEQLTVDARWGDPSKVQRLLEQGANPNAADEEGCTALYYASGRGQAEIVKLLLSAGADVNLANSRSGQTPLHAACSSVHPSVIALLLEAHADIDARNTGNETPLHLACRTGYKTVVPILLEAGADVDVLNKDGESPLYIACKGGHVDAVKLLLKHGATANPAPDQSLPLFIAAAEGYREIVQLLLEVNVKVGIAGRNKNTALHIASSNGYADIVGLLINAGADVNAANDHGRTALHNACKYGHDRITETLLRHRANPNLPDDSGSTPLHWAAGYGLEKSVSSLLAAGADPGLKDAEQRTPQQRAAEFKREGVVKMLGQQPMAADVPVVTGATKKYTVFISYRRDTGIDIAHNLEARLGMIGIKAFVDLHGLHQGKFKQQLLATIKESPNFIILLTPGSLDRCTNEGDWLRTEIAHALRTGCNIVPVRTPGAAIPEREAIPADIAEITEWQGTAYNPEDIRGTMINIVRLMEIPQEQRNEAILKILD